MRHLTFVSLLAAFLPVLSQAAPDYQLVPAFADNKINRPVVLAVPQDGTGRQFVVEQTGRVLLLPADDAGKASVFLDLKDKMQVENDFEEGLVGMAFHPGYKQNRKFYVTYAMQNPKINRISEFTASESDPGKADPASERVVLEIPRPHWNHNCGTLAFGPDGMLYAGVGDGGKGDDVTRLAQNLFLMNGKILRIDVDKRSGRRAYAIPEDNPFVKTAGAAPEIWATGLRNPWGMTFDPVTGDLWVADVGQEQREEIDIIRKGGNYGWSFREGTVPFVRRHTEPAADAVFAGPIYEYDRSQGISISGGVICRAPGLPQLKGNYIYGDWGSGNIWALQANAAEGKTLGNVQLIKPDPSTKYAKPTLICEGADHGVLVLDWNGAIFRLTVKE